MIKKSFYLTPEALVMEMDLLSSPLCDSGMDASLEELPENDFGEF